MVKKKTIQVFDESGKWETIPKPQTPRIKTIKISPELALSLVTDRGRVNRAIRKNRVLAYSRAMLKGNWRTTNPIHFDEEGFLRDGYHRLQAVIESEKSVEFIVHFGLTDAEVASLDEGRNRTTLDIIRLGGVDASNLAAKATDYILELSNMKRFLTREDKIKFYERHAEAAEWVASRMKRRGFQVNTVAALFVRAYYYCCNSEERLNALERFINIFQGSDYPRGDSESAAFVFHNHFLAAASRSGADRSEIVRAGAWCLNRFLRGEATSTTRKTNPIELFQLPEEKQYGNLRNFFDEN